MQTCTVSRRAPGYWRFTGSSEIRYGIRAAVRASAIFFGKGRYDVRALARTCAKRINGSGLGVMRSSSKGSPLPSVRRPSELPRNLRISSLSKLETLCASKCPLMAAVPGAAPSAGCSLRCTAPSPLSRAVRGAVWGGRFRLRFRLRHIRRGFGSGGGRGRLSLVIPLVHLPRRPSFRKLR